MHACIRVRADFVHWGFHHRRCRYAYHAGVLEYVRHFEQYFQASSRPHVVPHRACAHARN